MKMSAFGLTALLALALPALAHAQDGAAGGSAAPAPATVTSGGCVAGHMFAKADNATGYTTTSTSFVDVPGQVITLKVGGTIPSCLVVTFNAYSFAANTPSASQLMFVQATDNGIPIPPGQTQFSGDDDEDADFNWAREHSMSWAVNVNPGSHTIKIQFLSFFGGSVFLHKPTMTVYTK